jgi:hypothetical protein
VRSSAISPGRLIAASGASGNIGFRDAAVDNEAPTLVKALGAAADVVLDN